MKDIYKEYRGKSISAEQAAHYVKFRDRIFYGESVLFPNAIDEALSKRIHMLKGIDLRGARFPITPKIVEADPGQDYVILNDLSSAGVYGRLRNYEPSGDIPLNCSQTPQTTKKCHEFNIAFVKVSDMDKNGYFNFGLANSSTGAALSISKCIIVEVNKSVPYCFGGHRESIHISKVDFVVEGNHAPLMEFQPAAPQDVDRQIAGHIMKEIEDGACLQFGNDGLSNLISQMITESDLKDLGIHTGLLSDACMDLYHAGKITGSKKSIDQFKMTYTIATGTKKLYDFIDRNPACASYPTNYINDPRVIASNDNVVAINKALEIDLCGQVCSDFVDNMQKSETVAQLDFNLGAFMSRGGKGIIALNSTYSDKEGNLLSRIVPSLAPGSFVSVPSSMVQYVATEYGIVLLKGKTLWERADALISIAHPLFRRELTRQADSLKKYAAEFRH